ncbi:hypothetical protein K435DRAFT_870310 [Dendrothele bispora CBS 962.96]|uniref:Fungal N-terminal domain-containing protein n=1 Tax=Dendrothele bispora (strain CBS 962.96) TaxID=1314807 RepID=A0A4S8L710_DENBC|nr:hypothetical protein K435DRAFT_870310 [Dendrothele bispora CBS 962.96]
MPTSASSGSLLAISAQIAQIAEAASVVSPFPWIGLCANVVLRLIEAIEKVHKNAEELESLQRDCIDFIITVWDVVGKYKNEERGSNSPALLEFKGLCEYFTHDVEDIVEHLNALKANNRGWFKQFIKTKDIFKKLEKYKNRVVRIERNLLMTATLDTRLQAYRVENKLDLIDFHFRELRHDLKPLAKSRKASDSKLGNFRVFKRSDLELLPARSLSHLNYDGIVYHYASIVDRPDRIHVVRLYRGQNVNNQFEGDLHYYAKVWHPNLAQVFGVVASERAILLTGGEHITLSQYSATLSTALERMFFRLQLKHDFTTTENYLDTVGCGSIISLDTLVNPHTGQLCLIELSDILGIGLPESSPFYSLPSEERRHHYKHWHYIFRYYLTERELQSFLDKKSSILLPTSSSSAFTKNSLQKFIVFVSSLRVLDYEVALEPIPLPRILEPDYVLPLSPNSVFDKLSFGPEKPHAPDRNSHDGNYVNLPPPIVKLEPLSALNQPFELMWCRMCSLPLSCSARDSSQAHWTRFTITSPVDLLDIEVSIHKNGYAPAFEILLSQAHRIASEIPHFEPHQFLLPEVTKLRITLSESYSDSLKYTLENTFMVHGVQSSHCYQPPDKVYLFLENGYIEPDGRTSLTSGVFWSSNPDGRKRWGEEELERYLNFYGLKLDEDIIVIAKFRLVSWQRDHFDALRDVYTSYGLNPFGNDGAEYLGYPSLDVKQTTGNYLKKGQSCESLRVKYVCNDF